MKRSLKVISCVVAAVVMLLCMLTIAIQCDDACSNDYPVCQCISCSYYKVIAISHFDSLLPMRVVQHSLEFDSPEYYLLLTTDIFRPPIA